MPDPAEPTLVAVSRDRHGGRFWRRFTSYAFARPLRCVDVVLAELEPAASAFPLVFRETADGTGTEPVALLRLGTSGTTPFVAGDGTWRGTYVPSGLRAHPFAARNGDNGDMVLMVDEASGLVTDNPKDQQFFVDDGATAEALDQVIAFFRTRARSVVATRAACDALQSAGLLSPLHRLAGMSEEDPGGLLAVDIAKLDALDHRALPALWDTGAMKLAFAHRVSLSHADWIARVARADARARSDRKPADPAPNAGLAGFLDALSEAQEHDKGSQ